MALMKCKITREESMKVCSFAPRIFRVAAAAVVVAALVPRPATAQEAAGGSTTINTTSAGYLGLLSLRCDCTLRPDPDVRKRFFVFRSEPVVRSIEAGSPAAGVLRRGDAITHMDGISLLTTEGAQRFATIRPGQRVNLTIRRDGRTSTARLVAEAMDWSDRRVLGNVAPEAAIAYSMTWDVPPTPSVAPTPPEPPTARTPPPARVATPTTPRAPAAISEAWPATPRRPGFPGSVGRVDVPFGFATPRGWFGFSIRCNDCGWSSSEEPGASPVWESKSAPELSMVAPGSPAARAGFRPGDVLTHIDGTSILTSAGARKFGRVIPGQKVRVTVLRDGRTITRELTLTRRPEARAAAVAGVVAGTPPSPMSPAARRELRYTGRLEDVTVEVFSSGGPTVERIGDTMVITAGGTVVRLKVDPRK